MNQGQTIFAQLMERVPRYQFQLCVERYQGQRYVKDFSCWDQFLCLAFAQLTYRESLRDIETCLRAHRPQLYHMGFRGSSSRSTLAYANEHRDWRIYADFAQALIGMARQLYQGEAFGVELGQTVYALDSTTIDPRVRSAIRLACGAFTTSTPKKTCAWSFSPTTFDSTRSPSRASTARAGKSNCSFAGSNSICVSALSTALRKTPSRPKSGWPSAFTCSSPS